MLNSEALARLNLPSTKQAPEGADSLCIDKVIV
jgi:hypothetical protein